MYGSQKEYAMQKMPVLWVGLALITKNNRAVKKEREEAKKKKKFGTGGQKKMAYAHAPN